MALGLINTRVVLHVVIIQHPLQCLILTVFVLVE